jgi:hypothetical protein
MPFTAARKVFSQSSQMESPQGISSSADNLRTSAGEFFSFPKRSKPEALRGLAICESVESENSS